MGKTRIGVVGLGSFCTNYHLRNLWGHPSAEITAVCDVSDARLAKPDVSGIPAFTDHRQLLTSDLVDGVVVSTPNSHHFAPCRDALETGIPVLVDKPITVTGQEAEKLVALSKSTGLILMTAFTRHFMASTEHVRREIRAGEIEVQKITAVQQSSPIKNTINDGGMLHRRTVHILDVIPWLMDTHVVSVDAAVEYENGHTEETLVDALLHLENGQTANLLCIRNSKDFQDEVTIYAREKTYRLDKEDLHTFKHKLGWQRIKGLPDHGNSTAHFIDAVQGKSFDPGDPFSDLHSGDGLQSLRVLEAIHKAGRTGRVEELGST